MNDDRFDETHLNIPNFSILGKEHSHLFKKAKTRQGHELDYPPAFAQHAGFNQIFRPGELTFGVVAPFKGYPETAIPAIDDMADLAQKAEELGYAALWIRDVPFYDTSFGDVGQGLDPTVTLGYLVAKTQRIALGTAGLVAPLRQPIHMAKAAQSMEVLTQNRFVLGLSSGDRQTEYPAFNSNFEHRATHFREAWEMIRALTNKNTPFPGFQGEHYGTLHGRLGFIPQTKSALPMVAIGRCRQEFEWLATKADAWIWHGVNPNDTANIVSTLEGLNTDGVWHPFGYANFIELLDDVNAPAHLYNNIYLRGGSKGIAEFYADQKAQGLSHVTINFKPTYRDPVETLEDFAENVIAALR